MASELAPPADLRIYEPKPAPNGLARTSVLRWLSLNIRAHLIDAFVVDDEDAALGIRKITGGTGAAIRVRESHQVPEPASGTPFKPAGRLARRGVLILATDNCTVGGIQRYAWTWGEAALDLGYPARFASLWKRGAINGVGVSRLRAGWFTAKSVATAMFRRPRMVIATHLALSPVARIIERITGANYAVTLHGDDAWRIPSQTTALAVREAELRIPVSHFTRGVVAGLLNIDESAFYVTGSILGPKLQLMAASRRNVIPEVAAESQPPGSPYLLTVARLDLNAPYKRHDLVIRAMAELRGDYPELRYHVVGDGPYRAELESLAAECAVSDRVDFLGRISEEELAAENAGAYAFVMPSRISLDPPAGEGFGLVYLEAGIYGVPSIAADGGGSTETVLDGVTGILVEPDSLESLVTGIRKLLDDPELRDRLGREAPRRAVEFSYPVFRRKCEAVIAALSEGKDPREVEAEHDPHKIASWAKV